MMVSYYYNCSSSSSSAAAAEEERRRKRPPAWLQGLIGESFFGTCGAHAERRKNEKNVFCLLCCLTICPHCFPSHPSHPLLQVRRYVYHDVVRLEDLEKRIDCSYIQPYTINSAKVIFLKQRPQSRSGKAATSANFCSTCDRILQHPFRFCSLACKVEEGENMGCIPLTTGESEDMMMMSSSSGGAFSGFRLDDEGGGHVEQSNLGYYDIEEVDTSASGGEVIDERHRKKKKKQVGSGSGSIQAGINALSLSSRRKGAPHRAPLS
ncbi:Protein RGF1 INDUCIBLE TRANSCRIPTION FACTOR 1 [Linum grandiflorum]